MEDSGSCLRDATQAKNGRQAIRCARPMPHQRVTAGASSDRVKHDGDDDHIVGVAQHRNEIGYKVDR